MFTNYGCIDIYHLINLGLNTRRWFYIDFCQTTYNLIIYTKRNIQWCLAITLHGERINLFIVSTFNKCQYFYVFSELRQKVPRSFDFLRLLRSLSLMKILCKSLMYIFYRKIVSWWHYIHCQSTKVLWKHCSKLPERLFKRYDFDIWFKIHLNGYTNFDSKKWQLLRYTKLQKYINLNKLTS